MKTTASTLPDPGTMHRAGSVSWRVAPGEEAFLEALRGLRYETRRGVSGLEVLKDAEHVFWGRLRFAGRDYFVKGRRNTGWRRRLRSFGRASSAREEWRRTWWLRSRGIETADPVAAGEVRRLGCVVEEYLAFRWVPGAQSLISYLEAKEAELPRRRFERLRRRIAFLLGSLFGSMHALGAYHRQFHDRNILVAEGPDDLLRLLPIDLDHLTISGKLSEADRDWNFYQLAWHLRRTIGRWRPRAADAARFLKGYHLSDPGSAASWRDLFRRVQALVPSAPLAARPRRRDFRRKSGH